MSIAPPDPRAEAAPRVRSLRPLAGATVGRLERKHLHLLASIEHVRSVVTGAGAPAPFDPALQGAQDPHVGPATAPGEAYGTRTR